METFNLPMSPDSTLPPVIVTGTHICQVWDISRVDASPYGDKPGNDPDWLYNNEVIPPTLDPPLVLATLTNGFMVIQGQILIPSNQSVIDSLSAVVYTKENMDETEKLHVVACYINPEGYPNDLLYDFKFSFEVPNEANSEKIKNVELFLFKEDPKTSRGTVTTVIHASHDINQVK
ncbi:MAG: hypothetical protein ACJA0U_000208 [Salibacteraceae bacterium]|jgi:hypothetical protein